MMAVVHFVPALTASTENQVVDQELTAGLFFPKCSTTGSFIYSVFTAPDKLYQ